MAISAQTNVPELPPLKVVSVGPHYTYLWLAVKKKQRGRIVESKGKSSVGKILGGGSTGLVVWKDEFIAQYPELKAYNVYREEVQSGEHSTVNEYRFVFRPKVSSPEGNSMQAQQYYQAGATWLCDRKLSSSPLLVALNRTFMHDNRNLKLLSLCYFTLLHQSIDFGEYIHFCADTRLPWQGSMTEQDINALLQDISDVDLSHFFAQLQSLCARRISKRARFLALELDYPHNLMEQLLDRNLSLSTNFEALDKEVRRMLKDPALNSSTLHSRHQRWAQQQDEHALLIFNALNGMPHLFHTYNDADFTLKELCAFLRSQGLPESTAQEQILSLHRPKAGQKIRGVDSSSYGAAENSSEYLPEDDDDELSESKRTPSAASLLAEKVQRSLYTLGSYSGLGGISFSDAGEGDGGALSGVGGGALGRKDADGGIIKSIELNDSGSKRATLRTLSASDVFKNNQNLSSIVSTRKSSEALAAAAASEAVSVNQGLSFNWKSSAMQVAHEALFVTGRAQKMISKLRYFLQQKQDFLWVVPPQHHLFNQLLQRHELELLDTACYDPEYQCFKLTFKLKQHYPEYDVSTGPIGSALGEGGVGVMTGLFTGKSRFLPRKMLTSLYVHLVFDLKSLIALRDKQEHVDEDYIEESELADAFDEDEDSFMEDESLRPYFWRSDKIMRPSTLGSLLLSEEQCKALERVQALLSRYADHFMDSPLAQYMATLPPDPDDEDDYALENEDEDATASVDAARADTEDDEESFFDVPNDDDEVASDFFDVGDDDDDDNVRSTHHLKRQHVDDEAEEDADEASAAAEGTLFKPSAHYLRTGEVDPRALADAGVKGGYDSDMLDFEDEEQGHFPQALSETEKSRLLRSLQQLLRSEVAVKSGALQVLVSNRLDEAQEALQSAHYFRTGNRAFDLMSFDVFKTELSNLNPLTVAAKPALKQLLRGKNFLLFLALSLNFMLQASLEEKDRQYGSLLFRERLNIKSVELYLKMLQRIIAERRDTGFVYPRISQEQRALLEFLNVTVPSHESFTNSSSDSEVRLAAPVTWY